MDNDQFNAETNAATEGSDLADAMIGVVLGVATALLGGYLCGLMIDHFAPVGSISLWCSGSSRDLRLPS